MFILLRIISFIYAIKLQQYENTYNHMNNQITASLFGIGNSNRDFSKTTSWGKNQFNSSFPAALCCYLESKGFKANYCNIQNNAFLIEEKSIDKIFATSSMNDSAYFSFESSHTPYQRYVKGSLPRTDLVIQDNKTGACLRGLEVKLTALPDNTTCALGDEKYGSEIVVRPDTIVYLACSVIESIGNKLDTIIDSYKIDINDWTDPQEVLSKIDVINRCVTQISMDIEDTNIPFLLQPVWKTMGKSPELSDNCLDVFVWSNSAFCNFISNNCTTDINARSITRHTRTCIWLYKMLFDYAEFGAFDHSRIIDELSYNTKNDKAFASSGMVTNKYMVCQNLAKPRITKDEIKNIILGGGQKLLSPERRFDAIIYNSPELFNES